MAKIDIQQRKVELPNGHSYEMSVVTPGTGVGSIIVPLARHRGMVYVGLVEQWRETLQQRTIELPRGGTSDLSQEEALREANEEIGTEIDSLRFVGTISPDTGLLTTKVAVWIGAYPREVLDKKITRPNENDMVLRWEPAAVADGLLMRQPVVCSMSVAALHLVARTGILNSMG